jgi:Flp pilus assembly secretin CpaC
MTAASTGVRRSIGRGTLARLVNLLVVAFVLASAQPRTAWAGADLLAVTLDQAKMVRIPPGTQTLIIGNPIIADVTMLRSIGMMVVTGKSFGQTNLIALDSKGEPVAESMIRVGSSPDATVTVFRGLDRESYACDPRCQPIVNLGDSSKFLSDISGQVTSRNMLAAPTGGAQSSH